VNFNFLCSAVKKYYFGRAILGRAFSGNGFGEFNSQGTQKLCPSNCLTNNSLHYKFHFLCWAVQKFHFGGGILGNRGLILQRTLKFDLNNFLHYDFQLSMLNSRPTRSPTFLKFLAILWLFWCNFYVDFKNVLENKFGRTSAMQRGIFVTHFSKNLLKLPKTHFLTKIAVLFWCVEQARFADQIKKKIWNWSRGIQNSFNLTFLLRLRISDFDCLLLI